MENNYIQQSTRLLPSTFVVNQVMLIYIEIRNIKSKEKGALICNLINTLILNTFCYTLGLIGVLLYYTVI